MAPKSSYNLYSYIKLGQIPTAIPWHGKPKGKPQTLQQTYSWPPLPREKNSSIKVSQPPPLPGVMLSRPPPLSPSLHLPTTDRPRTTKRLLVGPWTQGQSASRQTARPHFIRRQLFNCQTRRKAPPRPHPCHAKPQAGGVAYHRPWARPSP